MMLDGDLDGVSEPVNPRAYIDELHRLRTEDRDADGVVRLADWLWASRSAGQMPDHVGLGAACQVAFIALMEAGRSTEAQVWRARATFAAADARELNTTAILLIPVAFATWDLNSQARGRDVDRALEVMAVVGEIADRLEAENWEGPGVSIAVIQRARYEKSGYLLWRSTRYFEAASCYERARAFAPDPSRDLVRVEAGTTLAELGLDEAATGHLNRDEAIRRFSGHMADAEGGSWADIAMIFEENVRRAREGVTSVQDLLPVEVEDRSAETPPFGAADPNRS